MNAYSADLRERVLAAVRETDLSQPEIAARFSVSLSAVEEWWRTFREMGRRAPLPFAGGAKRVLRPHAQVIREVVAQHPDATLAELCTRVAAKTGVQANPSMMCRELQILNLPRKKKACTTVNAKPHASKSSAKNMTPRRGRPCATSSHTSNSSMKAGRIWA